MKFFLGVFVGVIAAVLIGAGAVAIAFGNLGDIGHIEIGDRDKSADASKTYDLRDFDRIEIAGVYELDVAVGADYSVEISGPQAQLDRVEAMVENGELILDMRDRERGEKKRRDHDSLAARVTLPALTGVDVSGVVDADIEGVDAEEFAADISGVGEMEIRGSCGRFKAAVSGVGDLDAEELQCKDVAVDVSGIGEASVFASESVDASVSGMGEISIYGSPARVDKSGGLFSSIKVK